MQKICLSKFTKISPQFKETVLRNFLHCFYDSTVTQLDPRCIAKTVCVYRFQVLKIFLSYFLIQKKMLLFTELFIIMISGSF